MTGYESTAAHAARSPSNPAAARARPCAAVLKSRNRLSPYFRSISDGGQRGVVEVDVGEPLGDVVHVPSRARGVLERELAVVPGADDA